MAVLGSADYWGRPGRLKLLPAVCCGSAKDNSSRREGALTANEFAVRLTEQAGTDVRVRCYGNYRPSLVVSYLVH